MAQIHHLWKEATADLSFLVFNMKGREADIRSADVTNHNPAEAHQAEMEQMCCQYGVGLCPSSTTCCQQRLTRCSSHAAFPLAGLVLRSLPAQTAALQGLPTLPENSVPAACPPLFLGLTHHLLLATSRPVRRSVQLGAAEAPHQAPQRLANILENKCEVALFNIFKTCRKAFLEWW